MKRSVWRVGGIASVVLLAGTVPEAAEMALQVSDIRVEDAWIRTPAPSAEVTGGYLTIVNDGNAAVELVAASSPRARTIELHEMIMEGEVMRMRPVKAIAVPARGRTTLKPGGLHLMVFGLPDGLKPGVRIPLTLTFADGRIVEIETAIGNAEAHK